MKTWSWSPRSLTLLGLVLMTTQLLGGCDKENNNWKIVPPGDHPDLELTMSLDLDGADEAREWAPVHFKLNITNIGTVEAMEVVVADTLPPSLLFQLADASQGTFDAATWLWQLGTLEPDSTATLVLTAVVGRGTRGRLIENEARVVAVEPADPFTDNNVAVVGFTVLNFGPHAAPDYYEVDEGGTLDVPAPGVLMNDSDADGLPFTMARDPIATTQHGELRLRSDGSFTYVHSGNEQSLDYFWYRITNTSAESDTGMVTITINPINDAPIMSSIPPQTIVEGQSFPVLILDNYVSDADDPHASLTWEAIGADELTVTISATRRATITQPHDHWFGQESIIFKVTDPGGLSDERTVVFTVTPVNDPPVVGDIPSQSISRGGSFLPVPLDLYVHDVDNDVSELLWTFSGNGPLNVSINADRVATITPPNANWTGQATIIFRATDPGGLWDQDAATFSVTAK